MFAILAEDMSDGEAIVQIVKKHYNNDRLSLKPKGYDGGGGLCRKGARDIRAWRARGIGKFIVCHDADAHSPEDVKENLMEKVVRPSGAANCCIIAVPVQEIEAWLIADEEAIVGLIRSFQFKGHARPETISSPKEWLIKQSREQGGKPLYAPKIHNVGVAKRLRLDVVSAKCPSFASFREALNKAL